MNLGGNFRVNKCACCTLVFFLLLIIYWRSSFGTTVTSESNKSVNLRELLLSSIEAAERGGQKVVLGKTKHLNVQSKGKTKEGANDPVTDADYASHCAMSSALAERFPRVRLVSEEHTAAGACDAAVEAHSPRRVPVLHQLYDELVPSEDVTLWLDPLDATQEYTEDLNQYVTTMVCVAINGVPVIGVIHYPFSQTTYWAWNTKTTSDNIAPIVYKEQQHASPRVAVSRSHAGRVQTVAREAFGPSTAVTPAGGAGYKVMGVVNGTFDVYLHTTAINKWDLCAGDAIINTLNGRMTTLKGETIDYSPDSDVKVTDGLLVSLFDHDYYLSKVPKLMKAMA